MPTAGRWLVARAVLQFAVAGAVAVAIVGVATAIASRRVGEREAITEARTTTLIKAESVVEPASTDPLAGPNGDAANAARLTKLINERVLDPSLVRVKLWNADGDVVVSDEPRLVGQRFPLGESELAAMASGQIEASVSDLDEPENQYERELGTRLLEVYLPVYTPSGEPLLFEAYYRYNAVKASGARLWRSFAPIALGALIMLELVQIPLAWSLARRLRERLQERELLLQHTLEASDVERRQIASDLHDGVVQDLTGVAYKLSARARSGADDGSDELAETVRESIRSLRSLVIDLSPPNLREEGLESALHDLVDRARQSGLDASLDVSGLHRDLADRPASLVYRAAQEALRNSQQHAAASAVNVEVNDTERGVLLMVRDDGRGFDRATLAAREAQGHVGLKVLNGLVTDGGGTVKVDSAPGEGTTVVVEVPA